MQKPIQIQSLEQRLDYAISKFDQEQDLFVQSHLARYLAIITAGYFEQAVQSALTDFTSRSARQELTNYVDATLAWEGSINRDKLARILGRFNETWFESIEAIASDGEKNAVDSIKQLRDRLAHGLDNGTGYGTIKAYHQQTRMYVERILQILP